MLSDVEAAVLEHTLPASPFYTSLRLTRGSVHCRLQHIFFATTESSVFLSFFALIICLSPETTVKGDGTLSWG